MREGWIETELINVCTLQRGFDLPKDDRTNGPVPLMSSSGCIDSVADAKVIGPGVVTGRSGSIGQVYFVEKDFWPLNTTLYVKEFHGNYPRFIYYLLFKFELGRFTSGTGVPTLNRNHVHRELVRIPTNVEGQKHIVAILDEAFAGIATAVTNTEKNVANARELFESYLNAVFGSAGEECESGALGDICEILDSQRKPITKRDRVSGPYPYYGATGVLDCVDSYIFDEPLVLIGEDGAKWGAGENTAYAVDGKCWVNNHAHVIRPNRDVILDSWIIYYLHAIDLQRFISGLTVPKLNQGRLREIPIPLPPIHEQERIIAIVDDLYGEARRLESIYQQKLTSFSELKQSLLQKAFSGELTTAPRDEIETALA